MIILCAAFMLAEMGGRGEEEHGEYLLHQFMKEEWLNMCLPIFLRASQAAPISRVF